MSDLEPVPFEGEHTEDDLDLFGEYRHLYPIVVEGRTFWVPEDNTVLRVLQYVEIKHQAIRLPYKDYCWSDTDGCCLMRYREAPGAPVRNGRACCVPVRPGLEVVRLPKGGRACWPPE